MFALTGCGDTADESSSSPASSSPASSASSATSAPTEPSQPTESSKAPADGAVTGDGYSLTVPTGWTDLSAQAKKVPQLALADLAYGDTSEPTFASNLNTIVTPANGESVDGAGIRDDLASQVEKAIGVRPKPLDDVEFDGEQAIGQTATVQEQGATLIQYVAVHEDNAYTLTVTLSDARAADSDAIVGDVIDSWQWQ